MIRRSVTSGRFLPAASADRVPLLLAPVKCERISRGNVTRAAKRRARVLAVMGVLRRELGL
jgi:hypothetical protein